MWPWAAFVVFILLLLALDLGVFHRKAHAITLKEALILSGAWIGVALAFNVFIYFAYEHHWFGLDITGDEPDGWTAAVLFLTGYVVEKSLGLDNVFVIAAIFSYFRIPAIYQHRVLYWGIVGALAMRAAMILAGVALIQRFNWILYLFGAFLIVSGVKMALAQHAPDPEKNLIITLARRLLPVAQNLDGEWLVVRIEGKLVFTPLALALIMIETSDLIFAVDSVPAIFAITSDPVSCIHQQHNGRTWSALSVLRLSGCYRSPSLPTAHARAALGAHRHQFLLKDILPSGPDTVQYTLCVVALILAGGLAASLICAQRTSESCHLEIPARRGVMNRGNR